VTPIEVASNKVGPEIKVGSYPEAVAITPNGKTAYVTNLEGNSVTPIEVASNKAGPEIKVGSDPLGIAITPNGKTAYVANAGAAGAKSGSVTPIEVVSNKAGTEIKVGSEPYGVAVTPNGETAYVTNSGSNSVTPIEVASNKAGTEIKVGSEPDGIAITPNGKTAYVTNENANSGNSVTPIEVASNKAGAEIKVGEVPVGIAITPEGNTAYVTNLESKSVTPIEVASNKAGTEVKVGSEPDGIAIAPPNPPTVVTGAASELTPHSATLSATVDPNGKQVSACTFEYGTTTAYGKSAPCTPSPGSGENPVAVSAALTGLAPSSEYHYRISANNAGGRSKGSDATFKTLQSAPAVLTGAATAVTPGSATLDATVNPEGAEVSATNCKFEYGTSEAYGSSVNCEAAPGSGTSAVAVSAQITGLAADTTYYYRISATNAAGASKGSDATFKTLPNAPAVLTGGASSIAQTSATLNATVNPNGATVSQCKFEYGATTLYGNSVACSSSPGSGTSPVSVSAQITGLAANTIYYYRVSATNEGGTGEGLGEQLKTLPNAPVVMTGAATALTQGAATLNATVNPEGGEVSAANCKFEYGTSEAYGSSVSCEKAPGSGTSAVAVSAQIAGLTADTTYYYRVSATNEGGTSEGLGEQLKTLPDAPAVLTGGASSITQSSVTLSATVNPNGAIVSQCNFEYGATAGYGKSEPCTSSPGAGTSPVAVSASLTGLAANTTYHFRVSATNAGGTSKGSDETFTTPAAAEYGTCGKTSKVDKRYTSKYEDKNCTTANAKSEGEYEWVPTPEHSQIKTTDKTKTATLKSGHVSVVCKKSTSEGEITGPTTDTETVTYTDCAAAGKACTSAGASAGSIKTSLLDTSLVAEHGEVWTRYESSSPPYLDQFECAGIKYGVKGSVAAVDGCNVNVMATKDCETFAEGKGEQHLELEVLGGASEPAAELTTDTSKIATKVEIKTSS
jgi:YVTN family beta-propeller protein